MYKSRPSSSFCYMLKDAVPQVPPHWAKWSVQMPGAFDIRQSGGSALNAESDMT